MAWWNSVCVIGMFVIAFPVDLVSDADGDFVQVGQHVELGDEEIGDAVDPDRVPGDDRVEPAGPPWPPGGRAVLVADLAQVLAVLVEQLRGERARADPGR